MKTSIFFVLILSTLSGLAQNSGSGFSFQAIARDASGAIRKNEPIVIQFSLLKGSATGEAQWVETHSVNTDLNGIFSVIIGKGERQTSIQDTSFTQTTG
ncbi:MAG: hypothetical protein NTU44_12760 [Bacteroidetes bacterium]|nr:hypothetical protein [Bacteroidota bacterium]